MPSRQLVVGGAVAAVLLAAVALVSCDGPQGRSLPPPSSTSSTTSSSTTTEPDYSLVALPRVPGETTTTAPATTGRSTVRGVVVGPDGAVPGAVVVLERLVGDAVQRTEVATDENGGFIATELPGGRYRTRAFLEPELTTVDPSIFYMRDGDDEEVRLTLERFSGFTAAAATTPSSPTVGQGVNLAVRIAERIVDGDGIARDVPAAGALVRVQSSGWTPLDDEQEARTDADGVVVFQFRCDRSGTVTASVVVGEDGDNLPLDVPPCAPMPTTTTTTQPEGDDGDEDEDEADTTSTSTSRP